MYGNLVDGKSVNDSFVAGSFVCGSPLKSAPMPNRVTVQEKRKSPFLCVS